MQHIEKKCYCKYTKQICFTIREEPISMLDNGLDDGDHMDRCSCCHLCQSPEYNHRRTDREGRKVSQLDQPKLHFVLRKITEIWSEERKTFSPLSLCPEEVGPQDYGDVARSHLINVAVLSQFGQKLHQIPATETLLYTLQASAAVFHNRLTDILSRACDPLKRRDGLSMDTSSVS